MKKNLLVISFEKSIKYIMLIILPISFATMLYSNDIVVLFFGQKYSPTSSVLSILMWTVSLGFINGVCQNLLNASHKEKYVTLIFLVATLTNIILNFFIIPKYSYDCAAMTTVLSEIVLFILYFYSIYKLDALPKKRVYIDLFKILITSIILYYVLLVLNLNMWLALPVGIIIYLSVIISMKTIDEDDKFIIKEILGRKK